MALAVSHPGSSWQLRDIPGPLAFLALLAAFALLPGVVVAPVHYRSLARRIKGHLPAPGPLGLRRLWFVLAVVMTCGLLASYIFAYESFIELLGLSPFGSEPEPVAATALAHMILFHFLLMLLGTLPLLRGVDLRTFFLGRMRILPAIGLAVLVLLGTRLLISVYSATVVAFNGAADSMLPTESGPRLRRLHWWFPWWKRPSFVELRCKVFHATYQLDGPR
jgi:hypothetical protein